MATGVVKWFDAKKGFGFITPDLGPRDVFVHISALAAAGLQALAPGDRLEFELAQGSDGRLIALGLRPRVSEAEPVDPEAPHPEMPTFDMEDPETGA